MNSGNLIPNSDRTPEERKALATKAGKASGKARAEKKRLKEAVEKVLTASYQDEDGNKLSGYEIAAIALFDRVRSGDVSAFNSIRDLIGERPGDKIEPTIRSTENQKLASAYLEALKYGQGKSKKKTD